MSQSGKNLNHQYSAFSDRSKRRNLFCFFSPETPGGTLVLLGLVTLFLGIAGGIYLKFSAKPKREFPRPRFAPVSEESVPDFQVVSLGIPHAVSLSCGFLNSFFLLTEEELSYFSLIDSPEHKIEAKRRYSVPLESRPTASYFVINSESPIQGKLLIAFSNRILLFDPETREMVPYAELDERTQLIGLATDGQDIFAADSANGRVCRINPEKQVTEIGVSENGSDFPGFQKGVYSFFDLDIDPKNEVLYVTRPDQFRIEAFSALDGHWIPEKSWKNRASDNSKETDQGGFTGNANPASLIVLGDGTFLTSDSGPESEIQHFGSDGKFLVRVNKPSAGIPITADEAPLTSITMTETDAVRLLVLMPDGQLGCLTFPP